MAELKSLGVSGAGPTKNLEVFELKQPFVGIIKLESSELLCNCPVTSQPDYYKVVIEYTPGIKALETKSLKLYLQTFQEENHFAEDLVAILWKDIRNILSPEYLEINLTQQIRGGIIVNTICRELSAGFDYS